MKMQRSILSLLGVASLATVGITANTNVVEAAQLAPGQLGLTLTEELFFENNVLDSTPTGGNLPTPGTPGDFNVTFTNGEFTVAGFNGASGKIFDLYLPPSLIDDLAGNGSITTIQDGILYDFNNLTPLDILGTPPAELVSNFGFFPTVVAGQNAQRLLSFDTDADAAFDDFDYFITGFTRSTNFTAGAFRVTFDFEGILVDNNGFYDPTPTNISLFTGTTFQNPNLVIPPVLASDYVAGTTEPAVAASINGIIDTVAPTIPEPSSLVGLLMATGLGGLLTKNMTKRKN